MERKLELKDISRYLPYLPYLPYVQWGTTKNYLILPIYGANKEYVFSAEDEHCYEDCKIVLHPLSDLYKPIIHNEEEIVPIVELAKIALPLGDWIINQQYITDYCFSGQYGRFGYKNGSFWVEDIDTVPNQYQLFDYLHELKIDYRGLIDAGLAISVYDLENNPYK